MSEEDLPKTVTVEEQALGGGKTPAPPYDFLRALKEHIERVIDTAKPTDHHRAMALLKMEEMIFWIKAGSS
jgi:hypothetical protein